MDIWLSLLADQAHRVTCAYKAMRKAVLNMHMTWDAELPYSAWGPHELQAHCCAMLKARRPCTQSYSDRSLCDVWKVHNIMQF